LSRGEARKEGETVIRLGWHYGTRERTRFLLTAGGVAGAVVLSVFLAGVYRSAVSGSIDYIEAADADLWVARVGTDNLMRVGGDLPDSVVEAVAELPDVLSIEPISVALLPVGTSHASRTQLVVGLEPPAEAAAPRQMKTGRAVPEPGEIVVDRTFARRARIRLGESVTFADRWLKVVGITSGTNLLVTQYAFVHRSDLDAARGSEGEVSFLLVRTAPDRAGHLRRKILLDVDGAVAFTRTGFVRNNRREISSGFVPVLWAVSVLGIGVGTLTVALLMYAAVLEKRMDYAVLAALGAGDGSRLLVVLQQTLAAGLAGAVAGAGALALLAWLLPAVVPEVTVELDPSLLLAAGAGALVIAGLGAVPPAWAALRTLPMEALRR
jgi:ABC-type antimicrobial peptide transport system permease subunit